jgi:hypothetical protein
MTKWNGGSSLALAITGFAVCASIKSESQRVSALNVGKDIVRVSLEYYRNPKSAL